MSMLVRSGFWLLVLSLAATLATAQPQGADGKSPAAKPDAVAASGWQQLQPVQRQALAPLAERWDGLSDIQKRKWLALSRNFATMSPAEQGTLHSRMTEWAALSAKQRSVARLNYAKTQQLPADEKRAKWEAYQALSPEERRKLAAGTDRKPPPSAALAVKPAPAKRLAQVPQRKAAPAAPADTAPGGTVPPGRLP